MEALSEAPQDGSPGALVFIGFMGAGKSSAARAAAAELGVEPLDSDRELERELAEPLEAFFDREGEAVFRAREEEIVLRLLSRPDARVVALGGGSLGSERVRDALAAHTVVHLEVDPDDAWRRASNKGRPLARDRARFDQLHGDRSALYAAAADVVIPRGGRDAARRALPFLRALPPGSQARMGVVRVGRVPGVPRPGPRGVGLLPAAWRPALRGQRRARGAPSPRGRGGAHRA